MSRKRGKRKKEAAVSISSLRLDRVLFYSVVFLVFALPLFILPGISEYGYGKTMVALIGVSMLAILWGVSAWQKGTWTIRVPWIVVPILGLVLASLLSLVAATNGAVVIQSLVLVVFFALFMLIVANAVRDPRDATVLLFALLISGFLAALYGMLQYLGVLRGPTGATSGLDQIISTMGNRNYLGGFLAYLLFPAVVLVVRPRSRWVRLVSILLIAFCFGMILIVRQTGTTVALTLSAAALVVGIAIFRPIEPIRRSRTWLLILIGALVVTFLVEAPSSPLNSIVGLSSEGTSDCLLENPGFELGETGWGPNGYAVSGGGYESEHWWRIDRDETNVGATQTGEYARITVTPGRSYEFGGAVISSGTTSASVYLYALDKDGKRISIASAGSSSATTWKRLRGVFTPQEGTRYLSLKLWAVSRSGWVGFDDLVLRPIGRLEAALLRARLALSDRTRSWDWWVGWDMFVDHPVTGVGLGNYKLNFLPYKAEFLASPRGEAYDFYIDRAAQAHNEYVQVLAELGILGVLALVGFLGVLLATVWSRLRSTDETNRFDLLLFASGLATFALHAVVSFPAHLPSSTLVLVVTGGLMLSHAYGDTSQFRVKLAGWGMKSTILAVAVIGIVVSVFAVRDLSANLLMSEGIEQAQLGNTYGAETLLERSIALDFAPRQTYYHLATVQIERGAYDEAAENLERCFTRFVDEAVYLNYANLQLNASEYERAREAVSLLLATHPRKEIAARARYIEAAIVAQTGDPLGATALFEALVKDAPWFETGYIGLASIYQSRRMIAEARSTFEAGLATIDRKLEEAQQTLAAQDMITAEEYGKLRSDIANYQQQRETVLQRLAQLPSDDTP